MAAYVPYPALRRQDGSTQPSVTEHVSHEPNIGGSEAGKL